MDPLIIKATEDTPDIIFDPDNNIFSISNVSLPENATEFYAPVLEWLRQYKNEALPQTVFDFNIEYLNTASSKQVFEVVFLIDKISQESDSEVKIRWHYDKIDEDMQALGIRFTHLVKVEFELVEYEKEDDEYDDSDFF